MSMSSYVVVCPIAVFRTAYEYFAVSDEEMTYSYFGHFGPPVLAGWNKADFGCCLFGSRC